MSSDFDAFAADYDGTYAFRTQDVAFYVARARETGGPILEVGCGTGRIAVPMAETGAEVHGLDSSAGMLAVLRGKLAEKPGLLLHAHEGDMRTFDLDRTFAQVFVTFRTFSALDTIEDQLAALANFRKHLRPDGRLILDLFAPSYHLLSQERLSVPQPARQLPDGRTVLVVDHVRYTHRDQRLEVERHIETVEADGLVRRKLFRFSMRYLFRYEMELLLRLAGFRLETVLGEFDGRPYDYHSGEMIFVARADQ